MIKASGFMAMQKERRNTKESTLQLRVSSEQKNTLIRAAKLGNMTLSGFVLEKAFSAAQEILSAQSHFIMNQDQWDAFCKAIDAPVRIIPELKKLLDEDGLLDG